MIKQRGPCCVDVTTSLAWMSAMFGMDSRVLNQLMAELETFPTVYANMGSSISMCVMMLSH